MRVLVVDEGDVVAYEDAVLDRHTLADERVAGDLAVLADNRVLLDLHESAYLAVVPDCASVKVEELRKLYVFPERYI